jgi:hypothetical protein
VQSIPVFQISSQGTAKQIGAWIHEEKRLELVHLGFPLLKIGNHVLESDLPWVFWDMCPSGFLGRRFAKSQSNLILNADPRTWNALDALRAITEAGEDLSGNLIVGERSLDRWQEVAQADKEWLTQHPGSPLEIAVNEKEFTTLFREGEKSTHPSSLGGERPKIAVHAKGGRGGCFFKFSPPISSEMGQRWSDLLHMEAHCLRTLREAHLSTPYSECGPVIGNRLALISGRYDRTPNSGRLGATTLYWYAASELQNPSLPAPQVVRHLVDQGHLNESDFATVSNVHAFSAALGNNDSHLGNYGLIFDDNGKASMAPFYDILPMALAPMNDELPDDRIVKREAAKWNEPVASWMQTLISLAEKDEHISKPFLDLWRKLIGV